MEPKALLQALIQLWDDLPNLFGSAWTEISPSLEALVEKIKQTTDPEEQASVSEIVRLFESYPRALQQLGEVVEEMAEPLDVRAQGFLEVNQHSRGADSGVMGVSTLHLSTELGVESEPAVFYISDSRADILLNFRLLGSTIGCLKIEVRKDTLPEEQVRVLVKPVWTEAPYYYDVPPPDFEIRVTTQETNGRTQLTYVLHSPSSVGDFHYQRVGSVTIHSSPEAYQQHLMEKIEALARGRDPTDGHNLKPDEVRDQLEAIGHQLYEELFPPEMRRAYREFRRTIRERQVEIGHEWLPTLLITSDEPWIPWELIKPYDDSDPEDIVDDDFLCLQFQMTRWLAGRSGGAGKIRVTRLVCVEAPQVSVASALPYAKQERQYLAAMARDNGVDDASPDVAGRQEVKALLDEGGIHLWHFATHGNVNLSYPNESVLLLADGRYLRPEDIHGPRQTHITKDRPLVFLNACRVGQQSWSLTRLGGWVAAWVDRSRCGALIGTLWSVDDWLAYEFALTFYEALRRNQTIAQAAWTARRHIRDLDPANPTWLAYVVYAHPNAWVEIGSPKKQPVVDK